MGKARRRSAPVVVVIGLIAVVQGAVMVTLPIAAALGFSPRLLSAPLLTAPVFPAPVVSPVMPAAVVPVTVVMGE